MTTRRRVTRILGTGLIASMLASVGLLGAGTLNAAAAPTQAPRAHEVTLACSNGKTYEVVAPPGGLSMQSRSVAPAIILSGGVLIPTTITFTFPGFPPFTVTRGQGNPNANELTCTGSLGNGATVTATGFLAGG